MNKIKWFVILASLCLLWPIRIFAQSCSSVTSCPSGADQEACLSNLISACQTQRDTLSGEITYIDNQIRLTGLRIDATKSKIGTLLKEINQLEVEVQRLEGVLNTRLALLAHRIPESYKRSAISQFGLLLFSHNLSDFIERAKYLQTVQAEDAAIVFQVKSAQNSYNDSKQVREDKKTQLEGLQRQLQQQTVQYDQQKQEEDALLTVTNDTLERAQAQLEAIRSFVASLGGATILPHQEYHDSWGSYYNQRDANWGNNTIGSSGQSISNVGCLVTSVAMVLSHYGRSVTPADVAATNGAFVPGTAYMYYQPWSVGGATVNRTSVSISTSSIDSELSQGHPVIVGVYSGPAHFVVLKSGSNGNYTMNDPFIENGHDISFSSHYSVGLITEVDTMRVN